MSQISKCPKVVDVLSYWEASGEVSEPNYKSLLYFSFNGSYCTNCRYFLNIKTEKISDRGNILHHERRLLGCDLRATRPFTQSLKNL